MKLKACFNKLKPKNRKQKNIFGIAIILVLGVIAFLIYQFNQKPTTLKQDYHIDNIASISKIVIKDRQERSVTLENIKDSTWTANTKFEANPIMVKNLLETLRDIRIREPLPKAARNNIIRSLATSGKIVEIYTKDYLIDFWFVHLFKREHLNRTFFVGHETQDEMGTYMLKKGDEEPFVTYIPNFRGYISTRFEANVDFWKSHNVFRYKQSEIKTVKIDIPNQKQESFSLVNNGHGFDFKNADGVKIQNFDTTKVVSLLSSFVNMNYESVKRNVDKAEKDSIFSRNPLYVISVTNQKGKTEQLKIYPRPG
ncbi:MAG: DUF4340 domain-containing protein, partial [Bacteroidales bacterium]|nr:DUF4340 domain-containing protein [Bacteroidales bacterium]